MKPNVQAALEQFTHADTQDMWEAAKLPASEADLEVCAELLQVLVASADLQWRIAAGYALGSMDAPAAVEPLIGILDDKTQSPQLRDQGRGVSRVYLRWQPLPVLRASAIRMAHQLRAKPRKPSNRSKFDQNPPETPDPVEAVFFAGEIYFRRRQRRQSTRGSGAACRKWPHGGWGSS
jgi:hypothetical protein